MRKLILARWTRRKLKSGAEINPNKLEENPNPISNETLEVINNNCLSIVSSGIMNLLVVWSV